MLVIIVVIALVVGVFVDILATLVTIVGVDVAGTVVAVIIIIATVSFSFPFEVIPTAAGFVVPTARAICPVVRDGLVDVLILFGIFKRFGGICVIFGLFGVFDIDSLFSGSLFVGGGDVVGGNGIFGDVGVIDVITPVGVVTTVRLNFLAIDGDL